jgi:hypothetical protein
MKGPRARSAKLKWYQHDMTLNEEKMNWFGPKEGAQMGKLMDLWRMKLQAKVQINGFHWGFFLN